MKKKLMTALLLAATVSASTLALVACGESKESAQEHVHSESDWIVDTAATCTADGNKHTECTSCHERMNTATIEATGHRYATDWSSDETDHWYAATCEHSTEMKDKAAHTQSVWMIVEDATCTTDGSKQKECTVCHKVLATETIYAAGHRYATDWSSDETDHWYAATCGHSEVKDKAAHTPSEWIADTDGSGTETGTVHKECTVCHRVLATDIAPSQAVWIEKSGEDPVKVSLQRLRDLVNAGNSYAGYTVTLKTNVNLSGEAWVPIGTDEHPFAGNFNGGGFTISGLSDGGQTCSVFGLFGCVKNTAGAVTISNVTLSGVSVNQSKTGAGHAALIGSVLSGSVGLTIKNVTVSGSVSGCYHVGGFVGKLYSAGEVLFEDCVNNAAIENAGTGYTGGFVGIQSSQTLAKLTVKNCVNKGNVKQTAANTNGAAGFFGRVNDDGKNSIEAAFIGCSNEGTITNDLGAVAVGIANVHGAKSLLIRNCTNSGNISGTKAEANSIGIVSIGNVVSGTTFEGTITNSGTVFGYSASGILTLSMNKTAIFHGATMLNTGTVRGTKNAGGFTAFVQDGVLIKTGEEENSFENTGDISASYSDGACHVGGVFGMLQGNSYAIPFSVSVHGCVISGTGDGQGFHTDPNPYYVAVGGFAGRIYGTGNTFDGVSVTRVTLASGSQNTASRYLFAGGFVGLMSVSTDGDGNNTLTNATLQGNTVNAVQYKGYVAGCAYNATTTVAHSVLSYESASVDAQTDEMKHCGGSYDNAYLSPIEEMN